MKVVILNGSPIKEGNIAFLIGLLEKMLLGNGINVSIINLHELMSGLKKPFCSACSNPCSGVCYKGTKIEKVFEEIDEADALIVGSPVYFGEMTAQTKAFFDKTRRVRGNWLGKFAAAISCGASKYGGQESTLHSIHNILFVHGFNVFGDSTSGMPGHFGVAAHRPANEDEYAIKRVEALAKRLIEISII